MSVIEVTRLPGHTAVRLRRPSVSAVVRPRLLVTCLVLAALTVLVLCLGLATGDYPLGLPDVVQALVGAGDAGTRLIVVELRLPRALIGLLAGAAFAMSGAIMQTLTRNALASPDMLGITSGAGTAVVGGLVFGVGLGAQTLGLAGALLTAVLIYALAWNRGTTGFRIVLIGIGVNWVCVSIIQYLIVKAKEYQAQQAVGWLVGNLNGRGWEHVRPLAVALAVLIPLALLFGPWLRALQLGDQVAAGLGVPVQRARLALLCAAVGLVAFATAAAGPVAFVALAAPQIALRLAGTARPPLIASALTGALTVLGCDLIAQRLFADLELPVGVVTGVLGAPFLLWLLARANRIGSGG
ncbi:FecCD family ABC transporter permease [Thermomonospora umbrina]|uniref:Iron complex transport system permease protein n=1 Tax=Thermomonospora umbrina TaxID=111806 RepID=A0A3D9T426_9ACTN|nr:iron chelate uptake ABC transporter family permease subunit [Thermomonospora umbrina]REF00006.1 iron complex transport system permease protein [Thermomonospora umbrina]